MIDARSKSELLKILREQDSLLDDMLVQQNAVHEMVRNKNWIGLEDSIDMIRGIGDRFAELDDKRKLICDEDSSALYSPEMEGVFLSVRTKLSRSKIENDALSSYVHATRDFINGVLESCVPQHKTTVYSRNGKMVKPVVQSVVVNTLF